MKDIKNTLKLYHVHGVKYQGLSFFQFDLHIKGI